MRASYPRRHAKAMRLTQPRADPLAFAAGAQRRAGPEPLRIEISPRILRASPDLFCFVRHDIAHREKDLVLKARVLSFGEKFGIGGNRLADRADPFEFRPAEIAQDVVVDAILVPWMADTDPHAPIIIADMVADRAQTIMSGIAAADLDPEPPRRQVELVMENGDIGEIDLVEACRLADCAAGLVHESLGLQQDQAFVADRPFGGLALEAGAERRERMPARDRIDRHEADIVPVAGIGAAGIA